MASSRETARERRKKNLDECRRWSREYMRRTYHQNPEVRAARLAAARKWVEANPEKVKINMRRRKLWRKFGITLEQYDAMLQHQGGVCALCRNPPKKKVLVVDHNHKNGKVRGLLCDACNRALGLIEVRIGSLFPLYFYLVRDGSSVLGNINPRNLPNIRVPEIPEECRTAEIM